MPIYEYECELCKHELEKLQKVSDAPLTDCPACGKPGLRRKISAAGFRLKGSGWYETDFKSGNKKNLAGDSAGSSAASSSSASASESSPSSSPKDSSSTASAGGSQ
jgi:putative FmdB family regulatory protein